MDKVKAILDISAQFKNVLRELEVKPLNQEQSNQVADLTRWGISTILRVVSYDLSDIQLFDDSANYGGYIRISGKYFREHNCDGQQQEVDASINSLSQIKNLKKLKGQTKYFRIRSGDYRIGLYIENQVIEFTTIDHRKDIYKHFP